MKKISFLILLVVFSVLVISCQRNVTTLPTTQIAKLTADECVAKGGEILSTLDNPKYDEKLLLGEVVGMKCPCVCLRKESSANNGYAVTEKSIYKGKILAGTEKTKYIEFNKEDYENALKDKKKILLYFYANWCPICKQEQPETFAAFNEINDAGLIGFRVNYRDSDTNADEEALAKEFGITYQHTKIILKNGERVLKAPDAWNKQRYIDELTKNNK